MIEEFGPVTAEQLRELLESETLSDGDLVRQESSEVWIPISDARQSLFADSSDDASSLNEEIDDLSELAFEFEDSGPTTRRGAYAEDVTAEASSETETAASVPPISPRPVTPSPESPEHAQAEPGEEWFCESLGQVMGPMSFAELIELGKGGALDANDRVKCGEKGVWKIVEHLPSVMRAVAISRAIEVDPQMISSTTQKRVGDAAYAAMANSPEASAPPAAPQQPLQPSTPQAAALTSPSVAASATDLPQKGATASAAESAQSSPEKAKAAKKRPKRSRNVKGEDDLLDEIFDDVFNDDKASSLPKAPMHSMAAASMAPSAGSAAPGNLQSPPSQNPGLQNSTAAPSCSASQSSSTMSSGSNAASLAATAMASRPISFSKSSGRSFEINPKAIGMFVVILLVAAAGYHVWQNGLPMGSANGSGKFDRTGAVKALDAAMARYKAVGTSPSEAEWKEFSIKTKLEMSALFKSVYDRAGATPQGAACLAAITSLMKIAATTPENTEVIEKNIANFEKQILLVTTE